MWCCEFYAVGNIEFKGSVWLLEKKTHFLSLDSTLPLPLPFTDSADDTERHGFLGFASFLAQLGPHPFIPELLGVVSIRAPLVTVVEELENRDLLSFLWRCREVYFYRGYTTTENTNTITKQPFISIKKKYSKRNKLMFFVWFF